MNTLMYASRWCTERLRKAKQTRMMETVGKVERIYKKAPSYRQNDDKGKMGRSDEGLEGIERN